MSDPHDWNSWDHYRTIHDKRMQEHPFVLEDGLEWEIVGDLTGPDVIILYGRIVCEHGVLVDVQKALQCRLNSQGRLQVRGYSYAYNAFFAGKHNILRYDNFHEETPEEYHRHVFDLNTGTELDKKLLQREDMPVLADFLTEVADIASRHLGI